MFDEQQKAMKEKIIELRKQGKILDAEVYVDKCLALNPNDRYMLIDKGHCNMERQNYIRALECYKRAWQLGAEIPYVGRMILKCLKESGTPMTEDVVPVVLFLKDNQFGFKKFANLIRDYYEKSGDERVVAALPKLFESQTVGERNDMFSVTWTEDDEQYKFIDVDAYTADLQQQQAACNEAASVYNSGIKYGLELAEDFAIPYLRTEIEKANCLIGILNEDTELNAADIEFYTGYIIGLRAAMDTQKKYAVSHSAIKIKVLDLVSDDEFSLKLGSNDIGGVVDVDIDKISDVANFSADPEAAVRSINMCFCKKTDTEKVREILTDAGDDPVFICSDVSKKHSDANKYVIKLAKSKFMLANNETEYQIQNEWLCRDDELGDEEVSED